MSIDLRRPLRVLTSSLTLCLLVLLALPSQAVEKAHLRVDDYQIDATLEPHLHQITVKAKVKFTALQDLSVAVFELHNDLRVTKVSDEKNQALSAEYLNKNHKTMKPQVYVVPEHLDREIARLKLESMGHKLDVLTPEQEHYLASWNEGT